MIPQPKHAGERTRSVDAPAAADLPLGGAASQPVVSGIPRFVSPVSWSAPWVAELRAGAAQAELRPAESGRGRRERVRGLLKLSLYVGPFIAVAGCYEVLGAWFRHPALVHVEDLFALEQRLFSISTSGGPRAVSDIIASQTHPLLDLWCGLTYLLWVPEVFAMTALLFVRARSKALDLAFGFLALNLAGWAIWILYPAAPPWYVDLYGTGATVIDAPASTAGLARLDALLNLPVAASLYSKSAYVFGAMPSLHVAYSTLVATVVFPLGGKLRWVTLGFALSMAFSALYLRHHYVLDVLAGVALAVPVALSVRAALDRARRVSESRPSEGV